VTLKERLRSGEVVRGIFHEIPSAVAAQATAAAGADFVVVDCEHGPIGREAMHAMIAAAAGAGAAVLVRVPSVDEAEAKVALDAGADGVVFPLVRTREDAERAVAAVRYPPEGARGWGPFVAHARFGVPLGDHLARVGPQAVCVILLETVEAVEHADEILAVPGIDVAFVAPFDLSTALGVHGRFDAPELVEAIAVLEAAAKRHGVPLGGAALDPDATRALLERGHTFLVQGIDVLMLAGGTRAVREWS
jgi:4-hydroxy-2-oxoheptanedioate aldolase